MLATKPIPRAPGLPIVGNFLDFMRHRLELQARVAGECGELAELHIGPRTLLMVNSAALAREILVEKEDAFIKGYGTQLLRDMLGNGLLTAEGSAHRRLRKLAAPSFQYRRIMGYAEVFASYTLRRVQQWGSGQALDVHQEMMALTLAIVCKTLFDTNVEDADSKVVGDALDAALHATNQRLMLPIRIPLAWPTPPNLRLSRASRRLDAIIHRIIQARRASGTDRGDLLSMLLLVRDEDGSALDDVELRNQVMTMFLAGHETTANALSWALELLGRHPQVMSRLKAEVDGALRQRAARFEDLAGLPYTLAVLKETLRLYPPAYIVDREAVRPVTIGAHALASGTALLLNVYGIHRRGDVFPEPDAFRPERWEGDAERSLERCAYMPFGAGPRICIGQHFALMEAQIILATLVQHVTFERLSPTHAEPEAVVTLRPRHGVPMRITARRS